MVFCARWNGSAQAKDPSAHSTQENFVNALKTTPTTPELSASRRRLLATGDVRIRRRNLGKPRRRVTVSRPDIRASFAQWAARANSLQGSDIYQINDSVKTVEDWPKATIFKDASGSQPREFAAGDADEEMRT